MPIPIRSKNPPESLPIGTCLLIVTNVLVYALTTDGLAIREAVVQRWALKGTGFDPVHMLSSMFLHAGLLHLLGNMWFLYLFGFAVEGRLRTAKFLAVYFVSGCLGDLLHQAVVGRAFPDMPSLGASGAIMGVLGAALYLFPHAKVSIIWRYRVVDWPMMGIAAYYVGLDLLWAIVGARDGVAHFVHLGGAAGGFLLCALFRPLRDSEAASHAKATLTEVKDLGVLSRIELAEMHRSNPHDPVLAMHWMTKSLREPTGPKQDCSDAFLRLLPRMIGEVDVRSVAPCLIGLAHYSNAVSPRVLLDVAARMERAADYPNSMRLYEIAYAHPQATAADHEACLFRVGMLCESVFGNFSRAAECYKEILRCWPMGAFAAQAKARLAVVGPRAQSQVASTPSGPYSY